MNDTALFPILITLLGLAVGSFLNVVIVRIPKRLLEQAAEPIGYVPGVFQKSLLRTLLMPRSHCQQCKVTLPHRDNVPLLSYLWLKGRCRACKTLISFRYPLVELLTGLLSLQLSFHLGLSLEMFFALFFTWALVALAFIDAEHYILPDLITIPFLALGLGVNAFGLFVPFHAAALGAFFGFCFLWGIYWVYFLFTKKEGLGAGDFKLLAMLGAWLGWSALPLIVLFASILASLFGIGLMLAKKANRYSAIPFGVFLAMGGYLALLWGEDILALYRITIGIA